MKRIILAVLLALLAVPAVALASNHDLTNDQFFLPGSSTSGYRVHTATTRSHMNLTLPYGAIWAERGYKQTVAFSHISAASLTNTNLRVHGSDPLTASGGPTFARLGYEGSIIGVTLVASAALTGGTAACEPTIQVAGTVRGTDLIVRLSSAGPPQYASRVQPRGLDTFDSQSEIGARITTATVLTPARVGFLCTVLVEF